MRFLLDQNQSPLLAELLTEASHTAEHVRDLGLSEASDAVVLERARLLGAVLVSADTDFGELLAFTNAAGPSVLLLRRQQGRRVREVAALILANLPVFVADLESGAVVVLDEDRVRVRSLPFRPAE